MAADVDGHGMTDDATGLYKMSSTRKQRCEKGGDKGLQKQGKCQERYTTCGVFLAIQIKMAIFAYLKLYSQNNT